jgi:outer membrane receptor protein involved in Fe transport
MFNLSKTKEQLGKITNHLSLGILGTVAAIVPQTAESQERQIEEVVVSATKKDESASDIPVTVTALTEETLKEMNVSNFDEYIEYLPNVTNGGRGPGQSTIYIRGLAVDPVNVMLSTAAGSAPNVALYLDEQPVQVPGRNLDVYVADMERIEVIPGPQGTLFGASSQAGTVRMITNKPKYDVSEGGFNTNNFVTTNGSGSYAYDGFLNVPMNETWAIRGVFYKTQSGGYIDNVPGTMSSEGKGSFASLTPTASYITVDNDEFVKDDFNDSSYEGIRLSSKNTFGDDWELLVSHIDQTIEADGVWDYDPTLGDLKVQRFAEDTLEDTFTQTAITLDGRMGALDVVYTGSMLDRTATQAVDYTGYINTGAYMPYYTCIYWGSQLAALGGAGNETCGRPNTQVDVLDKNDRSTHEFRVSSNELSDLPFSYTAGVFVEESKMTTLNDFSYFGFNDVYPAVTGNCPIPGVVASNPECRNPETRFFNDVIRTDNQTAYFAEVTFPVNEKLDLTVGMRKYELDLDYEGQSKFGLLGSGGSSGRDYNSTLGHTSSPLTFEDTISKFTASYKQDEDTLIYFTRSEGYRPGGWNRNSGATPNCRSFATSAAGYCGGNPGDAGYRADIVVAYAPDNVINTELGIKTLLMDGAMRLNATWYNIEWTDIQVSQFDPVNVNFITFIENAADADISGLEADILWYPSDTVTVMGAIAFNDTEIVNNVAKTIPIVDIGSPLPLAPERQWNVRVRKDFNESYMQVAVKSASDTYNSFEAAKVLPQPRYMMMDVAWGKSLENVDVEFFIRNLTDERANLYYNDQDDIPRITTNRPRNMGVRMSYRF